MTESLPVWVQEWLGLIVPILHVLLVIVVAWVLQRLVRRLIRRLKESYSLPTALLVDASGSVSTSEFNLQRTGYINAFNNPDLYNTVIADLPTQAIAVTPPNHVILKVEYCEPGARGNTATNVTKPVKLETGAEILAPAFINIGDFLRIDTRTGEYIERAKDPNA